MLVSVRLPDLLYRYDRYLAAKRSITHLMREDEKIIVTLPTMIERLNKQEGFCLVRMIPLFD
jgi:hypothetical protein